MQELSSVVVYCQRWKMNLNELADGLLPCRLIFHVLLRRRGFLAHDEEVVELSKSNDKEAPPLM